MKEFTVKPNNSGFVEGVEQVRLNQLLADLDTEEFLAKQEADINPSPDAMSLEDAYGSVKPSGKPEDFEQITAIAKQAKAEQTARELNGDAKHPFHDAAQSTTASALKEQTPK